MERTPPRHCSSSITFSVKFTKLKLNFNEEHFLFQIFYFANRLCNRSTHQPFHEDQVIKRQTPLVVRRPLRAEVQQLPRPRQQDESSNTFQHLWGPPVNIIHYKIFDNKTG